MINIVNLNLLTHVINVDFLTSYYFLTQSSTGRVHRTSLAECSHAQVFLQNNNSNFKDHLKWSLKHTVY